LGDESFSKAPEFRLRGFFVPGETLNKSKNSEQQRLLLRDICALCVICG
jgi:hypothetical protein